MAHRALIVIDVQMDYFPGGRWPLDGMEAAADNAARLIATARSRSELIVHVRHEFPDPDAPFFAPGSQGAEIHPKVRPIEGEPLVLKRRINAFRDTDLKGILDRAGIEEVVVAGAMSNMCIDAAARAAADFGYSVTVVHDACAARGLEFGGVEVPAGQVHAAYMASLGFAYARMRSTDEFLAAGH
ncbi:unnamed protein product [Ostreobium quekettii]|uniref:Isochorismatase-like domain-containing protein n=1 Tax=Ostreobium quekettii TaxID=121088 RepID=A0A8S1IWI3_9CHLO|nr:unnamed protein product [Ostreobium quekettii]|eukprot:evm.model.scf_682EXC.6 EVM.evm.TU.scf_682EXC.6   scf_682EXC:32298-32852(-)